MDPPDEHLVARARQGDPAAFSDIYARFQPVLSRRLRRVLLFEDDVQDALQMTFVEAHRSLRRFRAGSSLEAWLHGIALNMAIRVRRSNGRTARLRERLNQATVVLADDRASSEEVAMRRQDLARLYEALEHLPPKKQIAFALHEGEGLKLAEIAALTNSSPQTVWARVESARKHVREWFAADRGGKTP